jgi:two-component system chemotaxis response regulator CheB
MAIKSSIVLAGLSPQQERRFHTLIVDAGFGEICGVGANLMDTYTMVEQLQPTLVIIWQSLTIQPEFEVMRGLFAVLDIRWLVLESATPGSGHSNFGADVFGLPTNATDSQIVGQILSVLRAKLNVAMTPCDGSKSDRDFSQALLLIGASTGGVEALLTVLGHLPASCPPTLVVQHTGQGFGNSLVSLLNKRLRPNVVSAQDGLQLRNGQIIIAAGSPGHLLISPSRKKQVILQTAPAINGHSPSVDALFSSALHLAPNVAAALLTGMGKDGAAGLLALRQAGAHTVVQDKNTSVVYGMPGVAKAMGAACDELPLPEIGPALLQAARRIEHSKQRRATA